MTSLSIGPLALPTAPLLLLAAFLLGSAAAARLAGRERRERVETTLWLALAAGLAAARLVHLLRHAEVYATVPWAVLDIRDGGWHAASGWVAGLAVVLARSAAARQDRKPLAAAVLLGATVWAAGDAWLLEQAGERGAGLPPVELVSIDSVQRQPLTALADGRPMVINLWASWCGPCREEMPVLAAAQRRHPSIRFVFANQGEAAETVRAYLRREQLALADLWLDPAAQLGPALGSRGLPTTVFVDAAGRRVHAHMGALNAAALEVAIDRIHPGPR